jgi:hypothetical protein
MGNEAITTLQLDVDLRPGVFDLVATPDQPVESEHRAPDRDDNQDDKHDDGDHGRLLSSSSTLWSGTPEWT